jgi:hypothetical protein
MQKLSPRQNITPQCSEADELIVDGEAIGTPVGTPGCVFWRTMARLNGRER